MTQWTDEQRAVIAASMKHQAGSVVPGLPRRLTGEALKGVLRHCMPATMAPQEALIFTAEQALDVIARDVPGVIVECGVWRGGCSMAMLLAQRETRGVVVKKAFLLDSFEGLPPASEHDGPLALAWQADPDGPEYLDNCRASLTDVRSALTSLELPLESWETVPGWFDDTAPALARRLADEGIALLRLDGDWYDSTMVCLEHLEPLVSDEGVVIIDDYYAWDGCARAVHDYLSRHQLAYRIRSLPSFSGAYFVKRPFRRAGDEL